jgi:hypothetical protein
MSDNNNNNNNNNNDSRAVEEAAGGQMQLPTNSAAGMMGVVQHMLGTIEHAAAAGQQEQQQAGGPPTTYVPLDPGSLMQTSMTAAGGDTRTAVGADPNAHTTQTYDPITNTLITTTVDPVTGGWARERGWKGGWQGAERHPLCLWIVHRMQAASSCLGFFTSSGCTVCKS